MFTTTPFARQASHSKRGYANNHSPNPALLQARLHLQSNILSDPDAEFNRLSQNQMISERFDHLNAYHHNEFSIPSELQKIALGRSFEMLEIFTYDHYVMHHAQRMDFLAINMLTKLLANQESQKVWTAFETVLRHPLDFAEMNHDMYSVEAFINKITWDNISEHNDHVYTKYLIATDAYLASIVQGESALRTLTENLNLKSSIKHQTLCNLASYYITDEMARTDFILELQETEKIACQGRGVLYTICVPKLYFNECAYLSQMLGIPADIKSNQMHAMLVKMQEELRVNQSFPQVRLLAHKLNADKVSTFVFPAMEDQLYFTLLQDIKSLIEKYKLYCDTSCESAEKRMLRLGCK